MKDRLLFGTIGLLVGVVAMQWAMPSGQATVATAPVGVVVAAAGDAVLAVDGGIWAYHAPSNGWVRMAESPVAVSDVQFFTAADMPEFDIVDKNGDQWERAGDTWFNRGQPPVAPVATSSVTFGKVKVQYRPKADKP